MEALAEEVTTAVAAATAAAVAVSTRLAACRCCEAYRR